MEQNSQSIAKQNLVSYLEIESMTICLKIDKEKRTKKTPTFRCLHNAIVKVTALKYLP